MLRVLEPLHAEGDIVTVSGGDTQTFQAFIFFLILLIIITIIITLFHEHDVLEGGEQ